MKKKIYIYHNLSESQMYNKVSVSELLFTQFTEMDSLK